jgi:hypothetical protein
VGLLTISILGALEMISTALAVSQQLPAIGVPTLASPKIWFPEKTLCTEESYLLLPLKLSTEMA